MRLPDKSLVCLWLLPGLHLAAAGVLALLIHLDLGGRIVLVLFDALMYADAALVGVWAGFGRHSKAAGFAGVGATILAIAALTFAALWHTMSGPAGPGNDVWVILWTLLLEVGLALLSMAVVVASLLWLRQQGLGLARQSPMAATAEVGPRHFSLRQLFLLMVVVGIVLKLGPVAQRHFNDYRSYLSSVVALTTGGCCFGAVGLLATWAVFGEPASMVRSVAAVVLAAAVGLLPPFYFPDLLSDNFAASVAVAVLELLFVITTLAVVRVWGYRIVRFTASAA